MCYVFEKAPIKVHLQSTLSQKRKSISRLLTSRSFNSLLFFHFFYFIFFLLAKKVP